MFWNFLKNLWKPKVLTFSTIPLNGGMNIIKCSSNTILLSPYVEKDGDLVLGVFTDVDDPNLHQELVIGVFGSNRANKFSIDSDAKFLGTVVSKRRHLHIMQFLGAKCTNISINLGHDKNDNTGSSKN